MARQPFGAFFIAFPTSRRHFDARAAEGMVAMAQTALRRDQGPDLSPWLQAQAALAVALADAALAVGQLDAIMQAMGDAQRQAATRRLALIEVEAMLWSQGMVLGREDIGRDLMEARAGSDLEAMRLARWAIRRLEGQGRLNDLRGFLGLYRGTETGAGDLVQRLQGDEFDAAASGFLALSEGLGALHPFARAPLQQVLWRMAELSAIGQPAEVAVWCARAMAAPCAALVFAPLGRHGRGIWQAGGAPDQRLALHLQALRHGACDAARHLLQLSEWAERARRESACIRGPNPGRVIAVLAAQPLVSAPMVEEQAGISRITAERMLNRLTGMGLLREVTGTTRFRLWRADL